MKKFLFTILCVLTSVMAYAQHNKFEFKDLQGIWIASCIYNSAGEAIGTDSALGFALTEYRTDEGINIAALSIQGESIKLPYVFSGTDLILFFTTDKRIFGKIRILSLTPKTSMVAAMEIGSTAAKFMFTYVENDSTADK